MNKYEKYINYIVNDIEPPYFKNMEEMYGLKPEEYKFILSKVYGQPITINDTFIYDSSGNIIYLEYSDGFWVKHEYDVNDNEIYYEDSDGSWYKKEFDSNGNMLYFERSDGYWTKKEYDVNGNVIYYETSRGYWEKSEYDQNGNVLYFENRDGVIEDYR